MKKTLLSGVLASVITMTTLVSCGNKSADVDVIKIGAMGPLSGSASTYGISVQEGTQLLEKEVNDAGGINGKKIKFVFQDDQADPNSSMQAFNKLVDDEKVCSILGPVTSGATLAVAPNATSRSIPMLTPTATEPTITKNGGDFMFRGCFVDSFQGDVLAKYSSETLKSKTAAVLYNSGSDYSKGIADTFKTKFEETGGTVSEFLSYSSDKETDFKAQLTTIKSSNPDIIVLPDYYNVVGLIAKQARGMGIQSQFLGGDGWESEELTKIGGDAVNGALYINHYYSGDESSAVKTFVESYKKEYNKEPDSFAALGYDNAKLLVKAIEKAGKTDGVAIKDALASIEIESVTGKIKFDSDRNAVKGAVIIKVDGGKKVLADKVNP
ncbi:ABC transporter substrate-binding protein [Clostridium sp. SHJSY1]|uniref:ABC transporter substrate-binding protein n=1 Tax=Clostridium sp. SHJSY1 TaxID=2942483 RepID=UPI0028760FD5|nr:ABC transporter substrate-binding protein [Clostridium sp. SHJSY1]MDS0527947.1 ABC transporter substrate-binding protein [Clostridium sp. SHJSY1]